MNKKYVTLCASILLGTTILAQQKDSIAAQELDEVVVSDSRFALKRENSGKTVITITAEELERSHGQPLAQVISGRSGITVNGGRSNAGQNISVFARGGSNRQVLVIIDGVQVNDPSNLNSEYDLRLLNTSQIESIEIVKGAGSTLYGNAAATAVINITTKKAAQEGISLDVQSSLGTNQSQNEQEYNISDFSNTVTLQAKYDKLSITASGGQQFTDGLSAAVGNEPDAFSRIDGLFKIGYDFSDTFTVTASAFYNKLDSEFDNGFPVEDAPFSFDGEQSRFSISSKLDYKNGSINFNGAFNQITRSFQSSFPSAFDSESVILDVFNKYTFNDKVYTILGLNVIDSKTQFAQEQNATTIDPYANFVYVSDFGLNLNAGVRLNNHSEYGSNFIYNLNPSYTIKTKDDGYLKFLGSFATSFIAPNLSQLFGPFGANPDLEPEENRTLEGGVEYRPSSKLRLSALYFSRSEDQTVFFFTDPVTFDSQFRNREEEANFNGLELELELKPVTGLVIKGNYTFVENDTELAVRIPRNSFNVLAGYQFNSKTYGSLSYQYNADRQDVFFDPVTFISSPVTLDAFGVLDAYFSHNISARLSVFASINNILNEDYQEVLDFTTLGRNVRVGMRLKL